ncbi:PREDICTED: probable Werner syndrome ATP-dependent helicase homolog 1 [Acropora digitifera]|uniref:probable Werner syndrome ATP-dependent helicase homolog 1 n=1 Tax=Acropora digitifera TaxID=70779 RepID=UPI00077AC796|nr:PREDICTED: probable Werner syndrome ATP-dependent helicase homolog 1 [Acropora digitifera]
MHFSRKAVDKLCDSTASLKVEQRDAVVSLLDGHDILAVLPTGFGKSLIFQASSIINDQISEARNMGLSASSVADLSLEELKSAKCQLLFGSAEKVLEERLLNVLKDNCSSIHQHLAAIVIDESHTVEMWTGKRSRNKTSTSAFREASGRLSTLRSFCQQVTDIAVVLNHLLLELGKSAYSPCDDQSSDNCLIGIYHSLTLHKYKDRIIKSFKGEGKKRVVIASTALSMGVNFPDVSYVIHWGPACSLLDYHQESGRGGRDGKQTQVLTIYHGQQVCFCEQDVKEFLQTDGCYRTEAYKPFDKKIQPHQPGHDCCKNCAQTCNCLDTGCNVTAPTFEREPEAIAEQPWMTRPISLKDRDALNKVMEMIVTTLNLFSKNISHGYANDIVEGLQKKAHTYLQYWMLQSVHPCFLFNMH